MKPITKYHSESVWAITSYFNPMGYRRKLSNFKIFRERLHAPLVAIELSYNDGFELQEGDAEILVQVQGGAVLWQKERLLNVALAALPGTCRYVAWVDCDILFGIADWTQSLSSLLERFLIVQLFKDKHYLCRHWDPGQNIANQVARTHASAAFTIASGRSPAACFAYQSLSGPTTGAAWAARRELLECHGFYDACIVGGGSRAMAYAAYGCFEAVFERHHMNKSQQQHYLDWARPFYDAVRGEVAYLDLDIFHLWHGDRVNRAYRGRHAELRSFNFDPFTDILISQNGTWSWNTDNPKMQEYLLAYFASRKEDG
jgi:hypothetical protein